MASKPEQKWFNLLTFSISPSLSVQKLEHFTVMEHICPSFGFWMGTFRI